MYYLSFIRTHCVTSFYSITRKLRSIVLNVYCKLSDGVRKALNHQMALQCFMEEVCFVHKKIRSAVKRIEFVTDVTPQC
jgi:hypothetical protein